MPRAAAVAPSGALSIVAAFVKRPGGRVAKGHNKMSGSGELSTIIGVDASLEGRLNVEHSMRVDGRIKGELVSGETVTIGPGGQVEGDITARDIIVGGAVTGKLNASGKVGLESKSVLSGDLKASRLVIQEGAVFNGTSDMGKVQRKPVVPTPRKINLTED